MELKEFAKLIALDNTNTAKNTLSYLIGNGHNNKDWDLALSSLYKSFPENLKSSLEAKKEFLPVMVKYFGVFDISEHNISIFEEYMDLMTPDAKNKIKNKNKNWKWEKEPEVVFKNVLELVRAMPKIHQGYNVYKFIEKYEDQIEGFISNEKTKKKIDEHFSKNRIWEQMIKDDYHLFSDFCEKHSFNKNNILKSVIKMKDSFSSFQFLGVLKDNQIDLFLNDFTDFKNSLKEDEKEIVFKYVKNKNEIIFHDLLDTIKHDEFNAAIKFMIYFEKEINNYLENKGVNHKIESGNDFKIALEKLIEEESSVPYRMNHVKEFNLRKVLENNAWFKFYDSYNLNQDLSKSLENKTEKKNKVKI